MDIKKEETNLVYRGILIGAEGVGKTALLSYLNDGKFIEPYRASLGIDFKKFPLTAQPENKTIEIQLWDHSGAERFTTICSAYLRQPGYVYVFCVDLTNAEISLSYINKRWQFIQQNQSSELPKKFILLGLKDDSTEKFPQEVVAGKTALQRFAQEKNITDIFYLSTKTSAGLEPFKNCLAHRCLELAEQNAAYEKLHPRKTRLPIQEDNWEESWFWQHRFALLTAAVFFIITALLLTIPFIGQLFGLTTALGLIASQTFLTTMLGLGSAAGIICGEIALCALAAGVVAFLGFTLVYGVTAWQNKLKEKTTWDEDESCCSFLGGLGSSEEDCCVESLWENCGNLWYDVKECTACRSEHKEDLSPLAPM